MFGFGVPEKNVVSPARPIAVALSVFLDRIRLTGFQNDDYRRTSVTYLTSIFHSNPTINPRYDEISKEQSPGSWLSRPFILPRFPHRLRFGWSLKTRRNRGGENEPAIPNQTNSEMLGRKVRTGYPNSWNWAYEQLSALIRLCRLFRKVVIVCPQSVACMSCLLTTDVADTNAMKLSFESWVRMRLMPNNEHRVNKFVSRFLAMLIFATVMGAASDCHAQRQRGLFKRARVQQEARQFDATNQQADFENSRQMRRHRNPAAPRQQGSPVPRFPESTEAFPKFIGGFHSSHYTNLGIPTGDLGFRGNGIYWPPW